MGKRIAKKVLLIGWDAADWKVIKPLMDSGEMPTLKGLIENGVHGNIATMDPPFSPMLWTSIATGKRPKEHGILGFIEPDPGNGGVRPVSNMSRKVKAIWNILTQKGMKSNTVAWWPSNPAEPINGVMVSNLYQKAKGNVGDPWPMLPGTVHPKALTDTIAELRVHPQELTEQHILPFIPNAAKVDQEKDKRLFSMMKILSETASVHAAGTYLLEHTEWDFSAIYFDGIDHFCHGFMKFHPPKLHENIPDDMFENYKGVVRAGYKFHDMMLERQLQLAGEDAIVILMSDHGFHSDHLRPKRIPKEPAGPAYEHRHYGIICMTGPGIKKGHQIFGASLLDITPTLLTLFGLPIGQDMEGKPLLDALEETITPEYIPSWEDVPGECGMHPKDMKENPWQSQESLQQLVELGYIEDPGEDKKAAEDKARREAKYNLGRSIINSGDYEEALPLFEELYNNEPEENRFILKYLNCLLALRKHKKAREVINKALADEKKAPILRFQEGQILLAEGRISQALEVFQKLSETRPDLLNLHLQMGNTYLKMGRFNDAKAAYEKALKVDVENSRALYGIGISCLRLNDYEGAIENLLGSTELVYHNPSAHFHLGEALVASGHDEYAINAFTVAVAQAPGMSRAHKWLAKLYAKMGDQNKATEHDQFISKNIKSPITIVSGLRRSGTSLLMQMLQAGGADVLFDDEKPADKHNPNGYFEYAPVKTLEKNIDWLQDVQGKAIKVPAKQLKHLPKEYNYRVIFLERDMDEILHSTQQAKGQKTEAFPLVLAQQLEKQLNAVKKHIEKQPQFEVLYMNYTDILENPTDEAIKIENFLGLGLDIQNTAKVIDKKLHKASGTVWK